MPPSILDIPEVLLLIILNNIVLDGEREGVCMMSRLSRVCPRFARVFSNPKNLRSLERIRMAVHEITIGQDGSAFALIVLGFSRLSYKRILKSFPATTTCNEQWPFHKTVMDRSSQASADFFNEFEFLIGTVNPETINFTNVILNRSFVSSLIEILNGRPRFRCLDFQTYTDRSIRTEFTDDIDDYTIGRLASQFCNIISIPTRFITSTFLKIWTEGATSDMKLKLLADSYESGILRTPISMENFDHIYIFNSRKSVVSIGDLFKAVERRIHIGPIKWRVSLSNDEFEIKNAIDRANDYEVEISNYYNIRRVLKMDGKNRKVFIRIQFKVDMNAFIVVVETESTLISS